MCVMDISSLAGDRSPDQDLTNGPMPGSPEVPIPVIARALQEAYDLELRSSKPAGGELDMNLRAETDQGRFLVKVGVPRA